MKKECIILLAAIIFGATTSCRKNYTCVCRYGSSSEGIAVGTVKKTRKNADKTCQGMESSGTTCTAESK